MQKTTDTTIVDRILEMVLPLINVDQPELHQTKNTHLPGISTRMVEQDMLTAFVGITNTVENIKRVQDTMACQLTEVHDVQFAKLFGTPKQKSLSHREKKKQEKALIESLRNNAHMKIANGL